MCPAQQVVHVGVQGVQNKAVSTGWQNNATQEDSSDTHRGDAQAESPVAMVARDVVDLVRNDKGASDADFKTILPGRS